MHEAGASPLPTEGGTRRIPNTRSGQVVRLMQMPERTPPGSGWSGTGPQDAELGALGPRWDQPQSVYDRVMRWAKPITLSAVGLSLLVHLSLWIIAAFL